jgi:hypothetical protein
MKGAETNGLCVLFVTIGPRIYAKFTAVGTVYFKFKFVVRLVYVHAVVLVYVRQQLTVGRAGRTIVLYAAYGWGTESILHLFMFGCVADFLN